MPRRVLTVDPRPFERVRLDFGWLLKLRWAAFAGQAATILLVVAWLRIDLPLWGLAAILLFEAFSNVVLTGWFRGRVERRGTEALDAAAIGRVMSAVLVLDVVLLTALLWLTGGTRNPFSVFYLVNIALAAVVLGPRWTALVTFAALVGYCTVHATHVPLPLLSELGAGTWGARVYDRGVLVAFVAATGVIAVFLTRVTAELSALERKLGEAELRKSRAERMEALGTLAAGAAHELASPLSTIAVASKDLEKLLEGHGQEQAEDARLIRREVERCRTILDQMALDAGQTKGSELVTTTVDELLESSLKDLRRAADVVCAVSDSCRGKPLLVPLRALSLALRQIVKNALDASPPGRMVDVDVTLEGELMRFEVYDRGEGMSADTVARATDPFFTTKEPGQGMGLGLFLAQNVIERLDGRIAFDSEPGQGTSVRIDLPLARLEPR